MFGAHHQSHWLTQPLAAPVTNPISSSMSSRRSGPFAALHRAVCVGRAGGVRACGDDDRRGAPVDRTGSHRQFGSKLPRSAERGGADSSHARTAGVKVNVIADLHRKAHFDRRLRHEKMLRAGFAQPRFATGAQKLRRRSRPSPSSRPAARHEFNAALPAAWGHSNRRNARRLPCSPMPSDRSRRPPGRGCAVCENADGNLGTGKSLSSATGTDGSRRASVVSPRPIIAREYLPRTPDPRPVRAMQLPKLETLSSLSASTTMALMRWSRHLKTMSRRPIPLALLLRRSRAGLLHPPRAPAPLPPIR